MQLEDHLGDIVRKARKAAGTSSEAAAQAAGINPAQLSELEETGATAAVPDFRELGALVGLDGSKLEKIAEGWLPPAIEMGGWREIRQITTSQRLVVNCYLVWDEVTREAALFDTGWEGAPIFEIVEQEKLDLRHLFITHTHEDHISALGEVRRKFPRIKLHSSSKNAPVDQRNRPNDFIHLGSLRITNRATPGHADDGVTYVIGNFPEDAPNVAIVGDCIFAGSIGTGFVSTDQLKESIRNQIFTLPDDALICPGHGPLTTVGTEKRHNPFF